MMAENFLINNVYFSLFDRGVLMCIFCCTVLLFDTNVCYLNLYFVKFLGCRDILWFMKFFVFYRLFCFLRMVLLRVAMNVLRV